MIASNEEVGCGCFEGDGREKTEWNTPLQWLYATAFLPTGVVQLAMQGTRRPVHKDVMNNVLRDGCASNPQGGGAEWTLPKFDSPTR